MKSWDDVKEMIVVLRVALLCLWDLKWVCFVIGGIEVSGTGVSCFELEAGLTCCIVFVLNIDTFPNAT